MRQTHNLLVGFGLVCAIGAASCSFSAQTSGLFGGRSSSPSSSGSSSSSSSSSSSGPVSTSGSPSAQTDNIVSGPAIWKRWSLRGYQLGTPRADLAKAGFTCGKYRTQRCFKILDKRCEEGHCSFKEDAFGQWFELNGAKTELDYITIATTDSDFARAYDMRYMVNPRQLLTPDSTLGKALIAKYGTPVTVDEPSTSDTVGGGRMIWRSTKEGQSPTVVADCTSGDRCSISIDDYGIMDVDREKQEELNKQKQRANQPAAAPQL